MEYVLARDRDIPLGNHEHRPKGQKMEEAGVFYPNPKKHLRPKLQWLIQLVVFLSILCLLYSTVNYASS